MFKLKLKAALFHFITTACVASLAGILVFFLWYPGKMHQMLHGSNMYGILMVLELALGPLMSLVIFNPKKTKRHLVLDYSVVGAVQFAALIYGLYSVSISRPVFLVFVKDRIEVISAVELLETDIREGGEDARLSWLGPKRVCVTFPDDPKERSDLLISALHGRDIQVFPKYYRNCLDGEVLSKSFSKERLFSDTRIKPAELPKNIVNKDFTWLPMVTRFGAWLVV
ncbi:MAG: hypothetical protein EOO68_36745, partial [Moraxellaceae bacterium]